MESSLNKVIEGFPANPAASSKVLQRLLVDGPQQFFLDALPLLRAAPDTPSFYYVLALLHSQNLVLKNLCDPALFSKPESIALAKRMSRVEPLFDIKLAKMLLATPETPGDEPEQEAQSLAGLRLLEIMAEASDHGRSLLLAQLLNHPNARIRSKAALLVGKSTKDAKWVSQRMGVADSRIRANALEALWGVESEDCHQVFLNALGDPANRVVGNGILGLYLLGVPSAIGSTLTMIAHPDDNFRRTGIWLMGEMGDMRFLPVLVRLMKESTPALRPYVFRTFAKLKQKRARLAALPALRVSALHPKTLVEGSWEVQVTALSGAGHPLADLKATQISLWENSDLVLEYSVRPVIEKEPLSIGFAVPRNTGPAHTPGVTEHALESCRQLKRRVDGWIVLQYGHSGDLDSGISASSLEDTIGSLIPGMSGGRGRRHLIFQDDGSCEPPDARALQEIVGAAKLADITIHGISLRKTTWRDICADTGGQWLLGANDSAVPELLTGLYGYLTARYQIQYRSDEAVDLRIEICTEQGFGEVILKA